MMQKTYECCAYKMICKSGREKLLTGYKKCNLIVMFSSWFGVFMPSVYLK